MGKDVIVIDDEHMMLDAIETILEDMGHQVKCFSSSVEGEQYASEQDFDLLITDIRMPERNGAELTEAIMKTKPDCNILVITGNPHDPLAKRALDAGAKGLVKKPFEIGKLLKYLTD